MPDWYVYILKSIAYEYTYIGSTNNLQRRLQQHNGGEVRSTRPYKPFTVIAFVAVTTEQKARKLEKYFKTGSGNAVLKKRILINSTAPR